MYWPPASTEIFREVGNFDESRPSHKDHLYYRRGPSIGVVLQNQHRHEKLGHNE